MSGAVFILLHDRFHAMQGDAGGRVLGAYATRAGAERALALLKDAGADGALSIVEARIEP